jgi:hypothetical protein
VASPPCNRQSDQRDSAYRQQDRTAGEHRGIAVGGKIARASRSHHGGSVPSWDRRHNYRHYHVRGDSSQIGSLLSESVFVAPGIVVDSDLRRISSGIPEVQETDGQQDDRGGGDQREDWKQFSHNGFRLSDRRSFLRGFGMAGSELVIDSPPRGIMIECRHLSALTPGISMRAQESARWPTVRVDL